ncbi:uncharacterized protein B0T15DRAFT_512934 [Chaetomium strumarium]|uniref:Uncharacterized protein n=1 Tax=Chaetomium strumarium TaxID=1170767 RepID=A0AAJ0GRJ9_9PEZI|nr:hypothetical protein B0T15DRAFT_512934 [Chaetomium strumarium]
MSVRVLGVLSQCLYIFELTIARIAIGHLSPATKAIHPTTTNDLDVIIILRNSGAPFTEAATEDPFTFAAGPIRYELQSTGGPGKKNKKKNKKKEKGPTRDAAIEQITATEEALAIKEATTEEVVTIEEASPEAPAEEALTIVTGEPATEAESVVDAELVAELDNLQGGRSEEQEDGRHFSDVSGMQLQVSSRHLILVSRYFQGALNGPWKEATSVSADRSRHVFAAD